MRLESKLNVVKEYHGRYPWLLIAVLIVFALLFFRLADLQLARGDKYLQLSEHNFVQERTIPALRGRIFDSENRVLTDNRPAYNIHLTPAFVRDMDRTLLKLEGYLNLSSEEAYRLRHRASSARGLRRYREILVKADISRDRLALMESHKLDLPGVTIRPGPRRHYPYGELFSHSIGYVGRIGDRELKAHPDYISSEQIGKKGVELKWEKWLHGTYGSERVVVDAQGRQKSSLESKVLIRDESDVMPVPGNDLKLSLDLDLQQTADRVFMGRAGSVLVMDVNSGFIKVWLSKPGFDPNKFAVGISQLDWERYRNSILDPLMDKVVQASYFPGSTYKVIPAIAALEEEAVTLSETTLCQGVKFIGKHSFHCWKRSGHIHVNFHKAIRESCDVYFYWLGEKLGFETVADWAGKFGIGSLTGSDFANETAGLLPDKKWHRKIHKRPWFPGDTMSHVIGQGDLKVSPLQLALLYAAIANGGRVMVPQIIESIVSNDGRILKSFEPKIKKKVDLHPETLTALRNALSAVVNEKGGTGRSSRLYEPLFAGKTGTAQVARLPADQRTHDDYQLRDHAWFVGYAPVEDPQIVVVAMVEHGEHGSWVAPVVRDVIAAWWEKTSGRPATGPNPAWYPPRKNEISEDEGGY